jgi:hypothetical protein
MLERRAHARREVSHRGLLSFDDGQSTLACQLVNLSEGGALVKVAAPQQLPELVSLFYDRLDERLPEVATASCVVVRRESGVVALKFLSAA